MGWFLLSGEAPKDEDASDEKQNPVTDHIPTSKIGVIACLNQKWKGLVERK
jgi:hypothetical protein